MSIEHSDLYCGFLGAVARSDECFGLLSPGEGLAIAMQDVSMWFLGSCKGRMKPRERQVSGSSLAAKGVHGDGVGGHLESDGCPDGASAVAVKNQNNR